MKLFKKKIGYVYYEYIKCKKYYVTDNNNVTSDIHQAHINTDKDIKKAYIFNCNNIYELGVYHYEKIYKNEKGEKMDEKRVKEISTPQESQDYDRKEFVNLKIKNGDKMKLNKASKKPIEISYMTYKDVVKEYEKDKLMKNINSIGHCRIIAEEKISCAANSFEKYDLIIDTLEGNYKFTKEDVLIVGIENELYPCKKDIFEKTYIKKEKIEKENDENIK